MASSPRVRLDPAARREQLLSLGVRLLATRSLDQLSIETLAEKAGISRGLLYHYFGNKKLFHEAVVRRAADELIEATAPPADGDHLTRLAHSMAAYLDYVVENHEGYLSLVKGAASGDESLREIYQESRSALTDRLFAEDPQGLMLPDTPSTRLVVHAWAAMVEGLVLQWAEQPDGVSRDEVLAILNGSLPALVALVV
ncbi:TetR/AcrR family transcriptional regulator [Nocardioides daejeonensis]|uniref:TetR/AcrR family transcriptional regulator n=1 Tax=Nocardioides daejeonensis TaxID=1046556 RepID=UPI000D748671|nr:TetR/AcrR family transcriptional regulator [Nocardioides daejeonensis]